MILSHSIKIVAIGLCLIYLPSQAMIVATSCLKRIPTKSRLVILHDKHAFDPNELIKKSHMDDMRKLTTILANKNKRVPFLLEIPEAHDPERIKNLVACPSHMMIKLALDNNMKYGSITFVPFDNRKEYDFFMRDMLAQPDQFVQAIKQNYPFSQQFHSITGDNFLEHLDDRYHSTMESIESLPVSSAIKKEYYDTNKQKYKNACTLLSRLSKTYNIKENQHLFNLIVQLNRSEQVELFLALTEENNNALDTNLLNNVLQQSKDHSLSVLLAGVAHSNNIEKKLLTQFPEFTKDQSSSMTLPDFKIDSLAHIQWPKNVPDNFMNKSMEQFINDL